MQPEGAGRARVLDAVRRTPGRSVSAIARDLGVDHSTAAYHLRKLERRRAVVSKPVGRERVWYPEGVLCPLLKAHWPTLARGRAVAEAALRGVARPPDIARAADLREPHARSRLSALVACGFVDRGDRGRYVAPPDLASCLQAMDRGGRCGLWGRCAFSRKYVLADDGA